MAFIIFVVILALLILFHEFGHFLLAKLFKFRVEEFGLGFPPRLLGFKRGETIYSINWLPFGGFVKIFGENPASPEASELVTDSANRFTVKPKWQQALVLVAGVSFNFILAWVLLTLGFATVGLPVSVRHTPLDYPLTNEAVVIVSLVPESPAALAGLLPGDRITAITLGAERQVAPTIEEIQATVGRAAERTVVLEYERGATGAGQEAQADLVSLKPLAAAPGGPVRLGVELDELGILKLPLAPALAAGARSAVSSLVLTAQGFGDLFSRWWQNEPVLASLTGPVGIVGLVGDASERGLAALILFTALLSINLAVLNLIPFPALDGGRLLFLLIEAISRRSIKPAVANVINLVGFSLLIILMLVVTYSDLARLFIG